MPRVLKPAQPLAARSLIGLLWLASPALPVGGFSYSEGLEAAVEAGGVHDEASARAWLQDQLGLSLARSEMPVVASAMRAWARADLARIAELNDWVLLTRETAEARQQTLQMGRSLAAWVAQRAPTDPRVTQLAQLLPAPTWPLGYALGAALVAAPLHEALLAFGFGWAENMTQAAVKTVPLGQSAGQRALQALADAMPAHAHAAARLTDTSRQSFAPMLAILGAQHETQYSRLFRS